MRGGPQYLEGPSQLYHSFILLWEWHSKPHSHKNYTMNSCFWSQILSLWVAELFCLLKVAKVVQTKHSLGLVLFMQSLCSFLGGNRWQSLSGLVVPICRDTQRLAFSCYSLGFYSHMKKAQEVQMCRSQQIHICIKFLEENFRNSES